MNNILPFIKKTTSASDITYTINIEFIDCGCYVVCTDYEGGEVFKEFWNWDRIYGECK